MAGVFPQPLTLLSSDARLVKQFLFSDIPIDYDDSDFEQALTEYIKQQLARQHCNEDDYGIAT